MCKIDISNYKSLLASDKNPCGGNIYYYEMFCKGYTCVVQICTADHISSRFLQFQNKE